MELEGVVLVVERDERTRGALRDGLSASGLRVVTAGTAAEAQRLLGSGVRADVLLLELAEDEGLGLGLLRVLRGRAIDAPAVLLGRAEARPPPEEAGPLGIAGFVPRPVELEAALTAVQRALVERPSESRGGAREEDAARPLRTSGVEGGFVSVSPALHRVFAMVDRVADADVPVLIRGESGVGKDVVARTIHARSRRRSRTFVKLNCAALPSELLESELFGHERGAFTGAHQEKPGKFELADGGTIFLDELGEMHFSLQAKLLQVLQDGEFYRVGGKRSIRVDARVVVATNRELEREIERGQFREDLYYRLNVVGIRVPALRERREDVAPLVEHFARKYAAGGSGWRPRPELLQRLCAYDWPGNVRELENLVRRLVVLGDEELVLAELSARGGPRGEPSPVSALPPVSAPEIGLKEIARQAAMRAEREAIDQALKATGWNKRKAAVRLKISYKALLYKIKECGLRDPRLAHVEEGA